MATTASSKYRTTSPCEATTACPAAARLSITATARSIPGTTEYPDYAIRYPMRAGRWLAEVARLV